MARRRARTGVHLGSVAPPPSSLLLAFWKAYSREWSRAVRPVPSGTEEEEKEEEEAPSWASP